MIQQGQLVNFGNPLSAPSVGEVRVNPVDSRHQIYTGSGWTTVSIADSQVYTESKKLDMLCAKYPGLAELREKFEVYKALVITLEDNEL